MIYQILGWPRSRTAWLSNFLTYGNSFCFHEGIALIAQNRLRTVEEYKNLFELYQRAYKHVGDANTLALLRQKYVIPGARIVVIEKENPEKDIQKLGYNVSIPKDIEYSYNELLIIKFDEINDNLKDIWDFCLPGEPYSRNREYLVKNLRIETLDVEKYLKIKDV